MNNEYSVSYKDPYIGDTYTWTITANTELAAKLICHNELRRDKLISKGSLQSFLTLCTCELN